MKQNQFEFKPFDQVLVREGDTNKWNASFFSRKILRDGYESFITTASFNYTQCIPYNDETKHLLGTTNPYKPKQKEPIYEVEFGFGEKLTKWSYTEKDFKEFISIAVCNNKDIKNFSVNVIIPD
jgi:hypothetical protein